MTKLRSVSILAFLAVALATAPARADDATELERAKASYDAGRYAEGVDRFRDILNPAAPNALHEPTAIERARAYYAACLIALGRSEEADAEIEKIIRNNPVYSPDPVAFPGKVVDRFFEIKSRLKGEIEATFRARATAELAAKAKAEKQQREYIEALQRLASQERVVVRHSRWIAMIPFGAGQFQNGQDSLGYGLFLAESALLLSTVVSDVIHDNLVANYDRTSQDFEDYEAQRILARNINLYSFSALSIVGLAGIIHAQATFVPESVEFRTRPIPPPPPPPTVAPKVGAGPAGFFLGLSGRF
jgi:tetratricopeptide (TPR) repeat protein